MSQPFRNSSFSQILPTLQLAWDSVSRGALKTCPRYYEYTIIQGYQTRAENIHFTFGIGVHSAKELYRRLITQGQSHDQALIETIRFLLAYTWDETRNRPWSSTEPTKTRSTLIRYVIWYLDQFQDDSLETVILKDNKPAVELSFHYDCGLKSITNEPILLCGHLDELVSWNDKFWIVDCKTTKQTLQKNAEEFFAKFSPDDQMSGYYFAGRVIFDKPISGIIIDAGQTAVTFAKFQRGFTYRTPTQLDEWFVNFEHWLRQAETYAQNKFWPMNEKSCNQYGGCPFRGVCSTSPELRQNLLDKLYTKRVWDPMISREV